MRIPVIARLAERGMRVRVLRGLTTGSILEFDKPIEHEVDLLANNKCIALGTAVKVGENFGLRITRVADEFQRIHALGEQ
jgi:flagellar motor switch protein FliN/FliY